MARRPLTLVERIRLGLRWYGLAVCVGLIAAAPVAWAANIWTTRADGDLSAKLWLTVMTAGVVIAALWFFRLVNTSRRQLLAGAEIAEDADADPAQR